jgi:hypothetical protein
MCEQDERLAEKIIHERTGLLRHSNNADYFVTKLVDCMKEYHQTLTNKNYGIKGDREEGQRA